MGRSPSVSFSGARIVVYLEWYGPNYCFHIDPGNGDTLPIYLDVYTRRRMERKVRRLYGKPVDIVAYETRREDGSTAKRYLKSIKESKTHAE